MRKTTSLNAVSWRTWGVRGLGTLAVCLLTGSLLAGPAVASVISSGEPCAVSDLRGVPPPPLPPPPERKPAPITLGGDALAGTGLAVAPGAPPLPETLTANSWVVADLDTGEVVGACGAHRMIAPASVQKILLAATVLPKLKPTDPVVVTPEDLDFGAEWDSKTVPLQAGQVYTVEDLFLGLLMRSGNDAANALARIAGRERGVAGTVADMNALARQLGAWDTYAATPSGLDGPGQVSSAYDQLLIFRAAYAHEPFRRWVRTRSHQMSSGLLIQHDNWEYLELPGSLGGKSGYTDIARHSFVGAAERDGRRLVAAVLGAEVMPARGWQQTAVLLDWGFAQPRGTAVGRLVEPGEADQLKSTRQAAPPPPVVVDPSSGGAGPALILAAGISAAAVLSLATIVFTGRGRRRPAAATASGKAVGTATASTTVAPPPEGPPASPHPFMGQPPPDAAPPAPPRPLMGQPPPPEP
jgi:D-alanyl-D-alanine carboxypeptidase (penicillin-binding protein 5/6)